jgi:hypothetical protein
MRRVTRASIPRGPTRNEWRRIGRGTRSAENVSQERSQRGLTIHGDGAAKVAVRAFIGIDIVTSTKT